MALAAPAAGAAPDAQAAPPRTEQERQRLAETLPPEPAPDQGIGIAFHFPDDTWVVRRFPSDEDGSILRTAAASVAQAPLAFQIQNVLNSLSSNKKSALLTQYVM